MCCALLQFYHTSLLHLRVCVFADSVSHITQSPASLSIGAASIPDVRWEDVGGLADVKEEIMDLVNYWTTRMCSFDVEGFG